MFFLKNFKRQSDLLFSILLIAAVLIAFRYVLPNGLFYTHDSVYQFVRLANFYTELNAGQFPVRWVENMNFGFGYPLFNYTYVFPYYLGSLLHWIGFEFTESIKLVTLVSLIGGSLGWYRWLRLHFNPLPSFIGSLLYILAPYQLLTVFVTGQLGTISSLLWFPWLLVGTHRIFASEDKNLFSGMIVLASAIAGQITTHLISAIVFSPFLIAYSVYLFVCTPKKKTIKLKIVAFTAAILAGLGLSAFYWIPAFLELPLVKAGDTGVVDYTQHFPSLQQLLYSAWGFGYSVLGTADAMSFQIGLAQLASFILTIFLLLMKFFGKQKRQRWDWLAVSVALIFIITGFLMLQASNSFWKYVSILQTVQHPWRFLIVPVMSGSVLATYLASQKKIGLVVGLFLILVAVANIRNYTRPQDIAYHYDEELLKKREMRQTGDIAAEFLPKSIAQPINSDIDYTFFGIKSVLPFSTKNVVLSLSTEEQTQLVFNKFYFPHWIIQDDGKNIPFAATDKGMLAVVLDQGKHNVTIAVGKTKIQRTSEYLSLAALLFVLTLSVLYYKHRV